MRIGLDMDDVIADTIPTYLRFYNKEKNTHYVIEDIQDYRFWELWGDEKESYRMFDRFYESLEFENLRLVPGARKNIIKLSKESNLFIITSRPIRLKKRTENFLESKFPGINFEVYHSNGFYNEGYANKADICRILCTSYMIEDCWEHSLKCAEKGINVLLLDKPWNRKFNDTNMIMRVSSWNKILTEIRRRE